MTKKRFVKLLMSHGEQIREARTIALRYNARGIPYKEAYSDYRLKKAVTRAFANASKAAVALGERVANVALSLKKFAEAIRNDRPNS